ncbi:MAG: cysteine--tRNA ligase [Chloroflexi bacterium]|nr:MAG: cysteine--tRNA ligase [Chloroflexota bacterium]MBL1197359.1 cysteine--tRNA ligase [Chloroflexota bacterium]NOH14656.1 cysteine--tRNA ligase [Chloroflexota bacterium]
MSLKVYNTLSRQKEDFEPLQAGMVSMYVCGPTVYDKAHVGHAMSSLVFDTIRRYLEYRGYKVKHVMNYTDVDDKIIVRALREEVEFIEVAQRYISEYGRHIDELNILHADVYPRATDEIGHIIEMVEDLIEKGYAYAAEGDVYFRVEKDDDYGKLSRRKLEDMQSGARIDVDERKENPMDFAVWKAAKEGEPAWGTPWGKGRPGWHIECSAMSLAHLGEQMDIHGGGNDLVFPHHENEIAQTESLTDKPFAKYWMHNGMLQLSGEKMSKSLGNLITIDDFLADHNADALRMIILNSQYRGPLTFNNEVIEQAERALERIHSAFRPANAGAAGLGDKAGELQEQVEAAKNSFVTAMDDDFNTPGALASIFDLVRNINQARDNGANEEEMAAAQGAIRELAGVLGLRLAAKDAADVDAKPFIDLLSQSEKELGKSETAADLSTAEAIDTLLVVRQELRAAKMWEQSDKVRDELAELGVVIEDSKDGATWRWK